MRRQETVAERILFPRQGEKREKYEEDIVLRKYRDKQVEEYIVKGYPSQASEIIEKRIRAAGGSGDSAALETLHFYKRAVEQYQLDGTIPEALSRLWDRPVDEYDKGLKV